MDNRKSNQKTFENASKTFLNACGQIAIRMAEVKEFEKQWAQLFVPLVAKFGPDVKINIADKQLLRTFRYDKFHIICDDLLSLVQHQSQIEYSACRLAARELRVKTLKELLQEEESKHYVGAEVPPEFREFINRDIAERRLSHFRKKLVWLLGEDEDAGKREESIRARLGAVEDAVNGLRQLFSHGFQEVLQVRYQSSWRELKIENFEKWFNNVFEVARTIEYVRSYTAYKDIVVRFDTPVSSQIDLMLFGNIESCIERVMGSSASGVGYAQKREAYLKSDEFIDFIVANQAAQ